MRKIVLPLSISMSMIVQPAFRKSSGVPFVDDHRTLGYFTLERVNVACKLQQKASKANAKGKAVHADAVATIKKYIKQAK